jgi:transposase
MATVLEECLTKEQRFVVRFLWAKGLNAKDIYKEIFIVYCGKCLSRKVVHNWVEKFSQGRSKVADDGRPGRPVDIVAEINVKRLVYCGFRRNGKAMGQVYQCRWRICQEIKVFFSQFRISHVFHS